MRTIKFTHEQIQLLSHALGIAEKQFMNLYQTIHVDNVNVRRICPTGDEQKSIDYIMGMAESIAKLNNELNDGSLDV